MTPPKQAATGRCRTPAGARRGRRPGRLLLLALGALLALAACQDQTRVEAETGLPGPSRVPSGIAHADRVANAVFVRLFDLKSSFPCLRNMPTRLPERDRSCPGTYRRTLSYQYGVLGTGLRSSIREGPYPVFAPGSIALVVDVRVGAPCLPLSGPTFQFDDVTVQVSCVGPECGDVWAALGPRLADLETGGLEDQLKSTGRH